MGGELPGAGTTAIESPELASRVARSLRELQQCLYDACPPSTMSAIVGKQPFGACCLCWMAMLDSVLPGYSHLVALFNPLKAGLACSCVFCSDMPLPAVLEALICHGACKGNVSKIHVAPLAQETHHSTTQLQPITTRKPLASIACNCRNSQAAGLQLLGTYTSCLLVFCLLWLQKFLLYWLMVQRFQFLTCMS